MRVSRGGVSSQNTHFEDEPFFCTASWSICLLMASSATSRLRRAFSASSSLSRLASSAFRPPYWARQRWKVCSLIASFWQDLADAQPQGQLDLRGAELGDDLVGGMLRHRRLLGLTDLQRLSYHLDPFSGIRPVSPARANETLGPSPYESVGGCGRQRLGALVLAPHHGADGQSAPLQRLIPHVSSLTPYTGCPGGLEPTASTLTESRANRYTTNTIKRFRIRDFEFETLSPPRRGRPRRQRDPRRP